MLRNRKNPHLKVSMAAADQDESVVIEDESGHRISWAFLGAEAVSPAALRDERAQKASQLDRIEQALIGTHAAALYSGIFPGADLKCSIQGHMFKDELIFASPESVKTIRLQLRAPGLKPSKDEQGSILIADENGEIVYTLPMPFLKDAQEESTFGSVEVRLENGKQPDAWQITYTPDKAWLAGAKYPVILDPAVITKKHSTAIEDNYITSSQPNTVQPYAGDWDADSYPFSLDCEQELVRVKKAAKDFSPYAKADIDYLGDNTNSITQMALNNLSTSWQPVSLIEPPTNYFRVIRPNKGEAIYQVYLSMKVKDEQGRRYWVETGLEDGSVLIVYNITREYDLPPDAVDLQG